MFSDILSLSKHFYDYKMLPRNRDGLCLINRLERLSYGTGIKAVSSIVDISRQDLS